MDDTVLESIKRWPDVPAVYGWLSLNARGQWRLHPDGKACNGGAGEPISNGHILAFINRNYGNDAQGRWFFQNGPQRVYVRLDAAPWVLFANDAQHLMSTHTGSPVNRIDQGWIDTQGQVFLQTEHGVGMVVDRDLPRLLTHALTSGAQLLEDWWAQGAESDCIVVDFDKHWNGCTNPLRIERLDTDHPIDCQLGFISNPEPS